MKKVIVLSIVAVLGLGMFSCKHHESCPAYGKAEVKSTVKKV
jgi:hypothetical protein